MQSSPQQILFAHPHTLFGQIEKVLREVGADNFFKSSNEKVKKAREGFFAYFLTLAMKKHTGGDWWIVQPNQAERPYPDFDFISIGGTVENLRLESVELTGIYPHFKSFNEALRVVQKKQGQYGSMPVKFSLLIFVNHEKSEEWVTLLRQHITTEHPFMSIWTIHLLFKEGGQEVKEAVAQRIQPLPGLRVIADLDDPEIFKEQSLPGYMEDEILDGVHYIRFKQEAIDKMIGFLNNQRFK